MSSRWPPRADCFRSKLIVSRPSWLAGDAGASCWREFIFRAPSRGSGMEFSLFGSLVRRALMIMDSSMLRAHDKEQQQQKQRQQIQRAG